MNERRMKDYDEWMNDKRLWWMKEGWKTMMNEWRIKDYDEWMKDRRLWWMNEKWLELLRILHVKSLKEKIDYFILSVNCVFFRKWFVSVSVVKYSQKETSQTNKQTNINMNMNMKSFPFLKINSLKP